MTLPIAASLAQLFAPSAPVARGRFVHADAAIPGIIGGLALQALGAPSASAALGSEFGGSEIAAPLPRPCLPGRLAALPSSSSPATLVVAGAAGVTGRATARTAARPTARPTTRPTASPRRLASACPGTMTAPMRVGSGFRLGLRVTGAPLAGAVVLALDGLLLPLLSSMAGRSILLRSALAGWCVLAGVRVVLPLLRRVIVSVSCRRF